MIGIGIDIIDINRVEKIIKKNKNFLNFILGDEEFEQLKLRDFPIASIAANFCAKEAFLKSVGAGLFKFDLKEIQILREKSGNPVVSLKGKTMKILKKENLKFFISITHTKNIACSVIICDK